MTTTARSRRARPAAGALLAASLLAAACTSDDDGGAAAGTTLPEAEAPETEDRDPYVTDRWYTGSDLGSGTDAPQGVLGSQDPGTNVWEEIPTTPFPTVEASHVVVKESFGLGQGAVHLVDLAEGSLGYLNIGTGADVWMPAGGAPDSPLLVAAVETFRPRGARGEIQAVVTFWDRDGSVADEILLPRYQYPSAGPIAPQLTSDGRYVIVNDRLIPGFLLIDVAEREVVAELPLEASCFSRLYLADASTAYAVCWETGEVVEIAIGDGTLEEVGRAVAFEPGTPVLEDATFSPESGLLAVYTRFSEVLPVDLSAGLPSAPAEPVELVEAGHIIRTGWNHLTPDGSRAVVGYVEGDDYGSGTPDVWRVFETATWTEVSRIDPEQDPAAMLPSRDSTGLYVLTNEVEVPVEGDEPDETEEVTTLTLLDLATGAETARTEIEATTSGDEFTSIYLPVVVEGGE